MHVEIESNRIITCMCYLYIGVVDNGKDGQ